MARPIWAADFEATTDPNDCRVWLWGLADSKTPDKCMRGTSLKSFITTVSRKDSITYFHNLKYDGHFILDWLLKNDFKLVKDGRAALAKGEFKTLISDMNKFYSIEVRWHNGKRTEFRDSFKKLPMELARVATSFGMETAKGELDYNAYRPIGHEPTPEEIEYLEADVYILAKAIGEVHDEGMKKLTVGSDSLAEYKELTGPVFNRTFPTLPEHIDQDIRRAYRGGFTYADPRFTKKLNGEGVVLDVNSLYPYVMADKDIPWGEPEFFPGYVKPTASHPLSIFTVTFTAKLKKNHIPCIQIKGNFRFMGTEYLRNIDEPVTLTVTSVDWELYNRHYHIDVLEFGGTYLFKSAQGLFDTYIDKWSKIKAEATGGKREIAKLHLNSLYGKLCTNPHVASKYPYLKEDGSVGYELGEEELRKPVYTAAGVFITAYAREHTINAAQANYDVFAYADTDSLHLLSPMIPSDLDIHPTRMGAWKHEYDFKHAYYVRAKVYFEQKHNGEYVNAVAGLPTKHSSTITFDQIKDGAVFGGKLAPASVPGGVVLKEIPFTLNL